MPTPKLHSVINSTLDSRSRAYMFGHQMLSKDELRAAMQVATDDRELKGSLRQIVLDRYKIRIAGGNF